MQSGCLQRGPSIMDAAALGRIYPVCSECLLSPGTTEGESEYRRKGLTLGEALSLLYRRELQGYGCQESLERRREGRQRSGRPSIHHHHHHVHCVRVFARVSCASSWLRCLWEMQMNKQLLPRLPKVVQKAGKEEKGRRMPREKS